MRDLKIKILLFGNVTFTLVRGIENVLCTLLKELLHGQFESAASTGISQINKVLFDLSNGDDRLVFHWNMQWCFCHEIAVFRQQVFKLLHLLTEILCNVLMCSSYWCSWLHKQLYWALLKYMLYICYITWFSRTLFCHVIFCL